MHGPTAAAIRPRDGAEPLHLGDGRLDHSAERAFPAGMGGADHTRFRVGEQHRRAVGGEDAEDQAGPVGDQRVRPAGGRRRNRRGDVDRVGRMDLVEGDQSRAGRHCFDRAAPVLADRLAVVVRSRGRR